MSSNGDARQHLMVRANEARSRLLHTIDQLDRRRHEALDLRLQLQRHFLQLVLTGAVLFLATVGAVVLVGQYIAGATRRRRRDRWRLARRVWLHPDRALRSEQPSLLRAFGQSLLLAILGAAVTQPARRFAAALVTTPSSASTARK
jgi:hypothetical protein